MSSSTSNDRSHLCHPELVSGSNKKYVKINIKIKENQNYTIIEIFFNFCKRFLFQFYGKVSKMPVSILHGKP